MSKEESDTRDQRPSSFSDGFESCGNSSHIGTYPTTGNSEFLEEKYRDGSLSLEHNPDNGTANRGGTGYCTIRADKENRGVLVKRLLPEHCNSYAAFESFKREFHIGNIFSGHANFRQYYKLENDENGSPVLEMELLLGYYGLNDIIDKLSPLSLDIENRIISQLLEAVNFMHNPGQGLPEVTHGDLKPANVMINPYKGFSLKIIDFGLSHIEGEDVVPGGTAGFSAPEQFSNNTSGLPPTKDILTDIYSLGKILDAINHKRYKEIADKASSIARSRRYQSIRELYEAYHHIYETLRRKTEWDSDDWKQKYFRALRIKDMDSKNALQKQVYFNSCSIIRNGGYDYGERNIAIGNQSTERKTIVYSNPMTSEKTSQAYMMSIDVRQEDALSAARELLEENLRPAVLCNCNRQSPKNSRGQSGNISRRTDLPFFLHQESQAYPLDRNWGGIYCHGVTVFRGKEQDGYPLLEYPFTLDIIAVPAINNPTLVNGKLSRAGATGTENKIRTIFRIAKSNGNDSLVLGAFGCGRYNNPPEDIARIFKSILSETEFATSFRKVIFAIEEDHVSFASNGDNGGNYGIFKHIIMNRKA